MQILPAQKIEQAITSLREVDNHYDGAIDELKSVRNAIFPDLLRVWLGIQHSSKFQECPTVPEHPDSTINVVYLYTHCYWNKRHSRVIRTRAWVTDDAGNIWERHTKKMSKWKFWSRRWWFESVDIHELDREVYEGMANRVVYDLECYMKEKQRSIAHNRNRAHNLKAVLSLVAPELTGE